MSDPLKVGHAAGCLAWLCPCCKQDFDLDKCTCDYDLAVRLDKENADLVNLCGQQTKELKELEAESDQLHSAIKLLVEPFENHCGDGSCVFGPPSGMHTNGGCTCFKYLGHPTERQLKRIALTLRRRSATQEQLETLRRLAGEVVTVLHESHGRLDAWVDFVPLMEAGDALAAHLEDKPEG